LANVLELLHLDAPNEMTTAATDVLLTVVCLVAATRLGAHAPSSARLRPWRIAFVLFAIGALLGAVGHGLRIPERFELVVWGPMYLALALAVAGFLIGVIHDAAPARLPALRPPVIGLGLVCFVVALIFPDLFLVFLIWQAFGLLVALAAYAWLWRGGRLAGAGWITLGLAISVLAAAIQGTGTASFTLIWPFDHNGIFHLVQVPGILAIAHGLAAGTVAKAG
jgi:hypothetical protein